MKNWELKKLGEICEFVGGSQPPKTDFSYEKKEGYIRLIQIRDYKSDNHIVYIPKNKAKRFCNSTDIMIGRYGPPVFQILKGLEGAYNVALMKAVPNENVLTKDFAFLFLKYSKIQDYVIHLSQRAAGQTGVNKEAIEDYPILLPPLPEQQRIVAILDEAFATIAKAKANAEQNLKNAKELFDSYLQSVFENKDEGWEEKCLDELGVITSSKRIYKSEYVKTGVPFYRTKEIKELSNGKEISLELFISKERYIDIKKSFGVPQIGDLLMSAVGTIGEIMVIENKEEFYFKDGNIVWFKEFKSLDTNYLKFALTAFVEKIKSLAIGSAYSALTIEKLNKYKISFPKSIKEQQAIVQKLDALSTQTKKLEAIYQQHLNDLDELKKSILQKAFNGELTTTTPR